MKDKKQQIMEAAVKCFAGKGFHATSIQEIADELGIAKGALYFYFKSKEDLLFQICEHHVRQFQQTVQAVLEDEELTPRQRLFRQVTVRFKQFHEHSDFINLFMREKFEVSEDIHRLFLSVRAQLLWNIQRCVAELYGEVVKPYSFDAATIFNSMIDTYMAHAIVDQRQFDGDTVAGFLMERLDELVNGMIDKAGTPLLDYEEMHGYLAPKQRAGEPPHADALQELNEIRSVLDTLSPDPALREEIEASLSLLEQEFGKAEPQPIMIKGMLAYLKTLKITDLKKHLSKLETFL